MFITVDKFVYVCVCMWCAHISAYVFVCVCAHVGVYVCVCVCIPPSTPLSVHDGWSGWSFIKFWEDSPTCLCL